MNGVSLVGLATLVDSLAAIKTIVFRDSTYSTDSGIGDGHSGIWPRQLHSLGRSPNSRYTV
ncbi:MAG: hypothetical protein GY801_17715 [bacterium]|nr:hypothetical protein [bacterium]